MPPAGAIFLTKEKELLKDLGAAADALLGKDLLPNDDRVYIDTVELGDKTFHCHSWVDIAQVCKTPEETLTSLLGVGGAMSGTLHHPHAYTAGACHAGLKGNILMGALKASCVPPHYITRKWDNKD